MTASRRTNRRGNATYNKLHMIWLDRHRIPKGRAWPFLNTIRASLTLMGETLQNDVDLTEGTGQVLVSGCIVAYQHAVTRRIFDLAQSVVICWNSALLNGAVVCSRALLETIATFHTFLGHAKKLVERGDWHKFQALVDAYAFPVLNRGKSSTAQFTSRISKTVTDFIRATHPEAVEFWDQICEIAHPTGDRMMNYAGTLRGGSFIPKPPADSESSQFIAIYNSLYSCCWFYAAAQEDLEIVLESLRSGKQLPDDHPLVVKKRQTDRVVEQLSREFAEAKQTKKTP